MQIEAVLAGFGGQGVMLAGKILAQTGMMLGKEVVWLPSYGPEMRGGTANCTVIISDEPIASPIIPHPRDAFVMNRPSLEKFVPMMRPGGVAVINTSLITVKPERDDVKVVNVTANKIAMKVGSAKSSNMVMLGAYVGATDVVPFDALMKEAKKAFQKKAKLASINIKCLEQGYKLGQAARAGH
ncbi:hypothetical protein CH330_02095 [candidate division WOR-3 bacterium JGI_Cruoil_03_51_56]|uniref:Pyruvate/ketoisovalerate oxidoreductase catalytic domain-containing protein n=1 Tax=candidate division WOR-3 bacterium JGI_Cruoil_03_51_56 TaxID=1973747 RepID=A0A235BYU2_UNCW3|nr:MAG: hypothetical protein CH330_02095 [candidate division WOR-3 bacterium JGI_Cruoil_03_51_56]